MNNPFRSIPPDRILSTSDKFIIVEDAYPVSPGHMLIISKREVITYFDLNEDEQIDLQHCIFRAKALIEEKHSPEGYNIGMNCGEAAGQTVMHFHCHVIPRYKGDMKNPRGGVRHCVEGKGSY
jgi:diadenosine tetraphosphate (Ap4A) HIT family hydrolase